MIVKDILQGVSGRKEELLGQVYARHLEFCGKEKETEEEKDQVLSEFSSFYDAILELQPVNTGSVLFASEHCLFMAKKNEIAKVFSAIDQLGIMDMDFASIPSGSHGIPVLSSLVQQGEWYQDVLLDQPIHSFIGLEADPCTFDGIDMLQMAAEILHTCACFTICRDDIDDNEDDEDAFEYCFDLSDEMEENRKEIQKVTRLLRKVYAKDGCSPRFINAVDRNPGWYGTVVNAFRDYSLYKHSQLIPVDKHYVVV